MNNQNVEKVFHTPDHRCSGILNLRSVYHTCRARAWTAVHSVSVAGVSGICAVSFSAVLEHGSIVADLEQYVRRLHQSLDSVEVEQILHRRRVVSRNPVRDATVIVSFSVIQITFMVSTGPLQDIYLKHIPIFGKKTLYIRLPISVIMDFFQ